MTASLAEVAAAGGMDDTWPNPRQARIALALLMIGAFFSCMDRTVIGLLAGPIKADFNLSDTQFGALQSLAFGAFYVLGAIPVGMLADRVNRRNLLAGLLASIAPAGAAHAHLLLSASAGSAPAPSNGLASPRNLASSSPRHLSCSEPMWKRCRRAICSF